MNKWIFCLCGGAIALPLPSFAPYTHQTSELNSLENWRTAQVLGRAPLHFDFQHAQEMPAEIGSPSSHFAWRSGGDSLALSGLLGSEWRHLGSDQAQAWDGGMRLWGKKGPLSFWTDARIYTEFHSLAAAPSYDREFVERQIEGSNGIQNSYLSYARYRGAMELTGDYGRLGFRRDALIWGPGSFYNLGFSAWGMPFAHLYYQGELGPIRVTSLWGRLNIPGTKEFGYSEHSRSIYAHRYEWNPTSRINLGLTEQLVTYDSEAFAALFPIVPLFMEKGQILEENNNGNLSADLSLLLTPGLMAYGEFFLDDLQEPTSLFNDFWGNRWAAMAGMRWAKSWQTGTLSQTFEWARVEPWVYSHYWANTAQTSSRGYPLGNPLGPNSMGISAQSYWQGSFWNAGLLLQWTWKGTDPGSSQEDAIYVYHPSTKIFLDGVQGPNWTIAPSLGMKWKGISAQGQMGIKDGSADWKFRLMGEY